jgi:hypothetical protein
VLTGTKDAGKAFEAIGVPFRQMVKDGASVEQILEATAKALAKIEDPVERAARQWEIFTAKGKAMGILMDTLAHTSIEDYINKMREAGIVTSDEANRMAREFDKNMDLMKRSMKGAAQSMIVDIMGLLDVAKKTWTQIVNIFTLGAEAAGKAAAKAMAEAGERPPPQDVGTAGKPRTLAAAPGPSEADVKKAEEAYDRIAIAAAKASGKALEAIEMERAARNKAMDEELAIAEKKYMELLKLPGKAEEAAKLRFEAEQKYQNQGLISEQKYADDRAAILTKWTADAIAATKPLGEEFGALGQKFEAAAFVKKSDDVIKGLEGMKGAIAGGDESFKRLGLSVEDVQRIIDKYKAAQQEAIAKGIDPFIEAEKKKKEAIDAAKKATDEAKKAADEATEATKKQSEALKQLSADIKIERENLSKLADLYSNTADAAGQSAIKRAEAEGRVTDAIALTRDLAIELAEREADATKTRADLLEALTGKWEEAAKIREMADITAVNKIVTAEEEAKNKRIAYLTDLEKKAEKTSQTLITTAKQTAKTIDEVLFGAWREPPGGRVFTSTLPPKPGGGIWTINDLLAAGSTYGLNAMSIILKQNQAASLKQQAGSPTFQHGGIVPGAGPRPILAHGGEMILTKTQQQALGGSTVTINITQAPNQDPQALVRALMPTLRGELARGTV